ncbi:MAG TPA: POTRA domain-containing protein, partial [Spirochaetota bacterium]
MRNKIYVVIMTAIAVSVVLAIVMPKKTIYPVSSRFEGKVVKMIDFIGVRKGADGKEETVPIRSFSGMNVLSEQARESSVLGKGETPALNVLYLNDTLDPVKIRDSIRALFLTGKVTDVRAEVEEYGDGVIVRFYCTERPIVTRIDFKGIDKVQEGDLKDKLLLKEGEPFRHDLLEKSLPAIKKKYAESGMFGAVLDYKVDPDPDKKDGSLRVTIIVDEGEEVAVSKVSILGAKQIPDTELKALIVTREKRFLDDGKYKREDLEMDKAKIVAYYKQSGYLDAEVLDDPNQVSYEWDNPENSGDNVRAIYITIKIKEGERYYFDGYEVNGISGTVGNKKTGDLITKESVEQGFELRKIDPEDMKEHISQEIASPSSDFDPDAVFNNTSFEKDRQKIAFRYASFGRIYSRVSPSYKDRYADITLNGKVERRKYRKYTFDIVEGPEAYVEKIYIRGNKKTKEKVIRREVLMKEETNGVCELFDSSKMEMTRERIYNLGFFKQVNIDIRPGTREDRVNVVIDVEEQSTGTVSLGGAWGSSGGFSIFATVGETNLMGNGQNINVKLNYGPQLIGGSINFTEPWLLDKPVALDASIFFNQTQKTDTSLFLNSNKSATYKTQTVGYSVGPTYRFLYYFSVGTDWTHSFKSIPEASGDCTDTVLLEKRRGYKEKRAISVFTGFNNIDNTLNPSRGMNIKFSTTFVGGTIVR